MDGEAMLGAPLLFALELAILYALPATVAVVAALLIAIWERTTRY